MKISARNCLEGKVVSIKKGPVSTEVTLETAAGEKIVSSITTASAESLGLDVGVKAFAVIKASSVMVAVEQSTHGYESPTRRLRDPGRFIREPAFLFPASF